MDLKSVFVKFSDRDLLHGDLVMKRFGSIRELKNIRPVEEVINGKN